MSSNLDVYQGDDYYGLVTVSNADDGSPADLTGYVPLAQIRAAEADCAEEVMATIETSLMPPSGVLLHIPREQTLLLGGYMVWDLQLTAPAPDGRVNTVLKGLVIFTREVSREPAP